MISVLPICLGSRSNGKPTVSETHSEQIGMIARLVLFGHLVDHRAQLVESAALGPDLGGDARRIDRPVRHVKMRDERVAVQSSRRRKRSTIGIASSMRNRLRTAPKAGHIDDGCLLTFELAVFPSAGRHRAAADGDDDRAHHAVGVVFAFEIAMIGTPAVREAAQRVVVAFAEAPQLVGGDRGAFHLRRVALQRHHELDEVDLVRDDRL